MSAAHFFTSNNPHFLCEEISSLLLSALTDITTYTRFMKGVTFALHGAGLFQRIA